MKKFKIGITPKGTHDSSVTYDLLDLVSDSHNFYLSKVANNTAALTDTASWEVVIDLAQIYADEKTRTTNEEARKVAEEKRQTDFSTAIKDCNSAKDNANETANNPTYIGNDHYVYQYDKTNKVYSKTAIYTKGDIGDAFPIIHIAGNTPTQAMNPNTFYKFTDAVTSLSLTLATPSNTDAVNEYLAEFTSDATTAATLSLPSTVKWVNGITPIIEVGKTYQLSILDDIAVMGGVS